MVGTLTSMERQELTSEEQFALAKSVIENIITNIYDDSEEVGWFQLDVSLSSDQIVWVELAMDTTDLSCVLWRNTDGFQFTDRVAFGASSVDADVFQSRLTQEIRNAVDQLIAKMRKFNRFGFPIFERS